MRNKITIILIMILFVPFISAQSGWYTQNSGTENFLYDVFFTDANSGWICGHGGIILHTSDGGNNWEEQNVPPSNDYSSIYFVDDQTGWSAGYIGLIYTSDGGSSWNIQSTPAQYSISDLFFVNESDGWTVGGKARTFTDPVREILHTGNGGSSWTIQYSVSNEDPLSAVYFVDENYGWVVGSSSTIMKTSDGGSNWVTQMSGPGYEFHDVHFINPDTGWVIGEDLSVEHLAVIFKTVDGGSTWDIQTFGSGEALTAIQFVNNITGWVSGGTNTEAIILSTTDGGDNWIYQDAGTNNFLSGLHFPDENNGWAVGFNGTIIHTDNTIPVELTDFSAAAVKSDVNLSWQTATETNNSGFEVQRSSQNNNYEHIGFVPGSGTTTETMKYNLTDKNVEAGEYFYRLVQVDFDGTKHKSEAVKVNVTSSILKDYNLSQNFPNPFNPSTVIQFYLPEEEFVSLSVFNALGETVKTLINERRQAGNHEIVFNGEDLSSGIYYYHLNAGNYNETKKMILLK